MVHGVLLFFGGAGWEGGHCGLKGQLIVGFVGKISFFLSKYIYSSLCSTNGVSQRGSQAGRKSWVGGSEQRKQERHEGVLSLLWGAPSPFSSVLPGISAPGPGSAGQARGIWRGKAPRSRRELFPHSCGQRGGGQVSGRGLCGGQDKQTTIAAVSRPGGSICPAPPGPKTGSAHPSPAIPPAPPQHWGFRSAFPTGQCLVTKGTPGPRARALQSQESYGASDKVTGQKPSPGQGGVLWDSSVNIR